MLSDGFQRIRLGVTSLLQLEKFLQCSLSDCCFLPFPFPQLAEVILRLRVFFWTRPVPTGGISRSLPSTSLQLQYAGLIVQILAGVLRRVMWTNKQGDCCVYSSHDGSRDGDLSSFGSMGCASL